MCWYMDGESSGASGKVLLATQMSPASQPSALPGPTLTVAASEAHQKQVLPGAPKIECEATF